MKVSRYKYRDKCNKDELFKEIEILTDSIDKIRDSDLNEKVSFVKRVWNKFKLFDDWLDNHKKETRTLKVLLIIVKLTVTGAGAFTIFEVALDLIL